MNEKESLPSKKGFEYTKPTAEPKRSGDIGHGDPYIEASAKSIAGLAGLFALAIIGAAIQGYAEQRTYVKEHTIKDRLENVTIQQVTGNRQNVKPRNDFEVFLDGNSALNKSQEQAKQEDAEEYLDERVNRQLPGYEVGVDKKSWATSRGEFYMKGYTVIPQPKELDSLLHPEKASLKRIASPNGTS
jgi:hypothetical protein